MIETFFANALMCMAINIYHEARNESVIGQIAVGQVVMNRVADERFPNTVCEVITQGKHYMTKDGTRYPVKDRAAISAGIVTGWVMRHATVKPSRNRKRLQRWCWRGGQARSLKVLHTTMLTMCFLHGRHITRRLSRLTAIFSTGGTDD